MGTGRGARTRRARGRRGRTTSTSSSSFVPAAAPAATPCAARPAEAPAHPVRTSSTCRADQAYELWFKQILWELNSVVELFSPDYVPESSVGLSTQRLHRVSEILRILVDQALGPPPSSAPSTHAHPAHPTRARSSPSSRR